MRFRAAIQGDLRQVIRQEWRASGKAIRAGMRETSTGLRDDLRADGAAAGLGRLSKVWRSRVYRGKRGPWETAALVYPKGGDRTRGAIDALETGKVIRPKNSRFLAIPTRFNRQGGRDNGKVLVKIGDVQGGFVQKSRNGTLILFGKVGHAQAKVKGKVRDRAFVNGHLLGGGRVKRTREILKSGIVPMFVLVKQVRIKKRLNIAGLTAKWEARLAGNVVKHWNRQNGR